MTINIKNGVYQEQLFARDNNKITFKGESREGTIIQYTNAEELAGGTGGSTGVAFEKGKDIGKSGGRAVILFEACDDIRFENMTLKNTYGKPKLLAFQSSGYILHQRLCMDEGLPCGRRL